MNIIVAIILTVAALTLYLCYLIIRNRKVLNFRLEIIELCSNWTQRHLPQIVLQQEQSALYWLYRKLPSYTKMLLSFKPLTLEKWVSEEDIKKLYSL